MTIGFTSDKVRLDNPWIRIRVHRSRDLTLESSSHACDYEQRREGEEKKIATSLATETDALRLEWD